MKKGSKKIWGKYWQKFAMGYCRPLSRYKEMCGVGGCEEIVEVTQWMRIRWDDAVGDYVEMGDVFDWYCPKHGYQMR
jgi:hypothetical protein